MRRRLEALDALLLTELAPGVRLYAMVLLVLTAFFLGLFTSFWHPEVEAERLAELEQEVREIRNQQRSLWDSHETMRERRDRWEAFGGERLALPTRNKKESP